MLVHELRVRGRRLSVTPRAVVQHGVNSDVVDLVPDGEFAACDRVSLIMTRDGRSTAYEWDGRPVPIPAALMEEPGQISLSVVGRPGGADRIVTEAMDRPLAVVPSGEVSGTYDPGDPRPDELQAAIEEARAAAALASGAAARCNRIGVGEGAPSVGGIESDLYVDALSGGLWRYENAEQT